MTKFNSSLNMGAAGALLLLALPTAAPAQEGNAIGNPQLRDFQLPGQRRIVTQPPPAPVVAAPPPATTTQPRTQTPAPARDTQARPAQPAPRPQAPAQATAPPQIQAQPQAPQPVPTATQTPLPAPAVPEAAPQAAPLPAAEPSGGFPWLYAIPAAALVLLGLALFLRRRRRAEAEAAYEPEIVEQPPVVAVAPVPVAEPVRRPWLELTLRVERASANLTETIVQFELEVANGGESAARNLRIDVKMFNAGAEQDKEIGAFFGTAGRDSTKLNLPGLAAGASGIIRGEVAMNRDDMRAVVLEEKYLFIPMLAVNALYDWGEGRTGQTSKSYVVGRELEQSAKMGAFRVDQGPRVWRTIGQRQHTLERRV